MTFAKLFSNTVQAAKYSQYRPTYPDELYANILDFSSGAPRELAVDIATGTGQAAIHLAGAQENCYACYYCRTFGLLLPSEKRSQLQAPAATKGGNAAVKRLQTFSEKQQRCSVTSCDGGLCLDPHTFLIFFTYCRDIQQSHRPRWEY